MNTTIIDRDLSTQAPHSPRERIGGFAVACRAVDKCRARLAGTSGEYHYDGPLDQQLFNYKGITGEQFTAAVKAAKNYDEVGAWLLAHGAEKTAPEIEDWSDDMEGESPLKNPAQRDQFIVSCHRLGLNPEKTTTFDWLEADDRFSFRRLTK
jgi:hypothetical protein